MPTPAPSLEKLFDIQANVEAAFAAYLTANGLASYATRSAENLPDARVIVQAEVGASVGGHEMRSDSTNTGAHEEDWFSLTLNFHVQTDRAIVAASPDAYLADLHDYWVARCKVLMLRGAINGTISGVTALSLSFYRIPVLTYSGDQYDTTTDALDTTSISYAAQVHILTDAWPA